MRKLSYFVAASIDGFIGAPDGEADFFTRHLTADFVEYLKNEAPDTLPTAARRAFGIDDEPNREYDTIIQGRASYDLALRIGVTSPYAHLREYVASNSITQSPDPNVRIVSGDIAAAVRDLKKEDGLGIYLCGGAHLAGQLIGEVDELVIKTYPVVLGAGMPMFSAPFRLADFALESLRSFDNGAVVRKYARKPEVEHTGQD
ncbi:dihydrofolate reductase family protein [Streptomyces sp. ISL-10]|uniref:dihydrofolate reductase family protein n=1 Tax=Streptomyces sp. ISL-10 TaxID=2819172 RepID=UPI001BEB16D0|nr:dihydrofolate reductase family protein [Streptomyces sp. ISL-10]MBT2365312.1 dihydrofolate reductase family protein [Streptomyces sp. ISL-10]